MELNFNSLEGFTPEEEKEVGGFTPIKKDGLNCVMTVEIIEGKQKFNTGHNIVTMSLQVVKNSPEFAGRYIGNFGKAMEFDLNEEVGLVEYEKDGKKQSFTREQSGLQRLATFIKNKVDVDLAESLIANKDEASLNNALSFMNGNIFVVNAFPSKKTDRDGNKLQGLRVVKLATEEDSAPAPVASDLDF